MTVKRHITQYSQPPSPHTYRHARVGLGDVDNRGVKLSLLVVRVADDCGGEGEGSHGEAPDWHRGRHGGGRGGGGAVGVDRSRNKWYGV